MLMTKKLEDGRKRHRMKNLLIPQKMAYIRPKIDFKTSTSIWHMDEFMKRRVNDWRKLTNEDGHTGLRSALRKDGVYTGTHSIFPVPLVEYAIARYGVEGGKLLDAFAGGPPRAIGASLMGMKYFGFEIRGDQIDENMEALESLNLDNITYILDDARTLDTKEMFDFALTCPPYYDVEVYSDNKNDLSTFRSYAEFDAAMWLCAHAHRPRMLPGSFVCIVVGNFRNKKTGEMIDFRGHTVENFLDAGFLFWEDIILSRNFGSAAKRAHNAWKGKKLVRRHEHLLVFLTPPADEEI